MKYRRWSIRLIDRNGNKLYSSQFAPQYPLIFINNPAFIELHDSRKEARDCLRVQKSIKPGEWGYREFAGVSLAVVPMEITITNLEK